MGHYDDFYEATMNGTCVEIPKKTLKTEEVINSGAVKANYYETFCRAVDLLVEANEAFRKLPIAQHLFQMQGRIAYASQQATVQVNSNRCCGKTKYIRSHAGCNDLIVTRSKDTVQEYHGVSTVWVAEAFKDLPVCRFNRIYVDEPFYVFKEIDWCHFYQALCKDAEQTFIFLGRQ